MHFSRSPLTVFFATFALVALFAVPAFAADREYPATAVAVAKPATLGVQTCKSNAYYSGRQLSFRARISRQTLDVPQKLAVKVSVYKRNNEDRKFKRISSEKWATASDLNAGIYQHDVIVSSDLIDTRAEYKAKAQFRWGNATTGSTEARKTVWSKPCKQRAKLPKLRLSWTNTVQVPGEPKVTHTFTVANTGASEAVDISLILTNDIDNGVGSVYTPIDSIGPNQTVTVNVTAAACNAWAKAMIVPRLSLLRTGVLLDSTAYITECK